MENEEEVVAEKSEAKVDLKQRLPERPVIHFCSGLPRAGSTLLMNILAQNPRFHCTATSGICDIMMQVKTVWHKQDAFRAMQETERDDAMIRSLRGMLLGYHANVDKPVVFDKSRGWLGELEMLEEILGRKVKVLVPVRSLLDVLSSFEKLYRKTKSVRRLSQEEVNYAQYQTVEGRARVLAGEGHLVGSAYNRIKDAYARGFDDRMHFVEFDKLTRSPKTTLREIYEFLDEDPFDHDFNHVEQVTQEDDSVHIWKDLHKIRPAVEPMDPQWPKILKPHLKPEVLKQYKEEMFFWQEFGKVEE